MSHQEEQFSRAQRVASQASTGGLISSDKNYLACSVFIVGFLFVYFTNFEKHLKLGKMHIKIWILGFS